MAQWLCDRMRAMVIESVGYRMCCSTRARHLSCVCFARATGAIDARLAAWFAWRFGGARACASKQLIGFQMAATMVSAINHRCGNLQRHSRLPNSGGDCPVLFFNERKGDMTDAPPFRVRASLMYIGAHCVGNSDVSL